MKSNDTAPAGLPGAVIHDRGRGPEIQGTRITVYDVLDYVLACWPPERIASLFGVSTAQVEAAVDYIRDHKIAVLTAYLKILERSGRGNPPELQAQLDANHARFQELVKQVRDIQGRAKEDIQQLVRRHRTVPSQRDLDAGDHGG